LKLENSVKTDAEHVRYRNMKAIPIFFLLTTYRHKLFLEGKDRIVQEYEESIQQLQSKYDVDINVMKQEHALSAAKVRFHVYISFKCCLFLKWSPQYK